MTESSVETQSVASEAFEQTDHSPEANGVPVEPAAALAKANPRKKTSKPKSKAPSKPKATKVKGKPAKASKAKPTAPVKSKSRPKASANGLPLRLPQVRILKALHGGKIMTRAKLAKAAGFTPISGTMSRCMNGSAKNGYLSLAENKLVERVELKGEENDGASETLYQNTKAGEKALAGFLKSHKIAKLKDKAICTNKRYLTKSAKPAKKATTGKPKTRKPAKVESQKQDAIHF